MRNLAEILTPGAPSLPEGLRTLVVSPDHELEPGMTVNAAFTFRNQGGAPATGVRVRFSVPEGLMYLVGTGRLDGVGIDDERGNSPLITREGAHIGDVAPGEERRIEAAFCVAGSIENGTTVELQAAVASFEVPPVGSNVVRLIARSRPQLSGELTGITFEPRGDRATPGGEALVSVRVNNAGESSAHDVVVAAPVPEHTAYVAESARVNGREIERELGRAFDSVRAPVVAANLPVGASVVLSYRVRIDAPLPDDTPIVATAHVASQETPAFGLESTALPVRSAPDFNGAETVLNVNPPGSVRPGERVTLALTVHNAGSATAAGVRAQLRLPSALLAVRGASRVDGHPVREQRKDPFTFEFGSIAAGGRVELQCEAVVASPLPDGTSLPVSGALTWAAGGERTFEHTLTVRSGPAFLPRASRVTRTGNAVVRPGDEVEAEISFTNSGSGAAGDAVLQIKIDSAFDDVRVTENGAAVVLDGDSAELGAIDPYAERRFVVRAHVRSPYPDRSEIKVSAVLHAREIAEVSLGEALWRVDSQPEFSPESSRMTMHSETILRPNCTADVEIALANLGTEVARDVRVRLYVSPEARLENVDGAMHEKSSLLFGDIAPAAIATARLSVRLLRSAGDRRPVGIDAVLSAESMLPMPLGRLEIATSATPDFAVGTFRSETPADIPAGETAHWVLHLRNGGDGTARSVHVQIEQPSSLIYVPNSTRVNGVPVRDGGAYAPFASESGLVLSDVEPGVEAVVRWADVVHNGLGAGTAILRVARISYDDGRSDEIAATTLTVRGTPGFANAIAGLPFGLDGALGPAPNGTEALTESRFVELPRATPIDESASSESVFGAVHFAALDSSDTNGPSLTAADSPAQDNSQDTAGTLVAFSRSRLAHAQRFLEEARFERPVAHLFGLRAFFPDAVGEAGVPSPSLTAMREVLRESLDRLFIKMRLPDYKIAPRDLETAPARSVLERFLLDASGAHGLPPDDDGAVLSLRGSYDARELREHFAGMQHAPAATAAPWAALARLLPDSTQAARAYRSQLIAWLDGRLTESPEEFARALDQPGMGGEIDDAYAAFREETLSTAATPSA